MRLLAATAEYGIYHGQYLMGVYWCINTIVRSALEHGGAVISVSVDRRNYDVGMWDVLPIGDFTQKGICPFYVTIKQNKGGTVYYQSRLRIMCVFCVCYSYLGEAQGIVYLHEML